MQLSLDPLELLSCLLLTGLLALDHARVADQQLLCRHHTPQQSNMVNGLHSGTNHTTSGSARTALQHWSEERVKVGEGLGQAVLDGTGGCCVSGTVDACSVCDGTAVVIDAYGTCCASELDAGRQKLKSAPQKKR